MRRRFDIPSDSKVRRCLFGRPAAREQSYVDNLENIRQEEEAREREEAKQKWNFDFEKEEPILGVYQWEKCDGSESNYIGTRQEATTVISSKSDEMDFQKVTETTPAKQKINEAEFCEPLQKIRKISDATSADRKARRNITF